MEQEEALRLLGVGSSVRYAENLVRSQIDKWEALGLDCDYERRVLADLGKVQDVLTAQRWALYKHDGTTGSVLAEVAA